MRSRKRRSSIRIGGSDEGPFLFTDITCQYRDFDISNRYRMKYLH